MLRCMVTAYNRSGLARSISHIVQAHPSPEKLWTNKWPVSTPLEGLRAYEYPTVHTIDVVPRQG